ncbi:MAG: M3 family metallopeptidase [Bacteroidales bacterium]|nr:M3 family metallopeptidase [Bacteroidales bacterium]
MENPLLQPSSLPFGAPRFDLIRPEHWKPAFEAAIAAGKAEVDAIAANPAAPDFANTVEALEFAGTALDRVSGLFFNLLEAESDDAMQQLAEEISPLLTDYELYISLNETLFSRIRTVYDGRDALQLAPDQRKLLEESYKGFTRSGALLSPADKKTYASLEEELALLELKYGKNVLDATNAFSLEITDEAELEGLPQYVRDAAAQAAREKGRSGWRFDLSHPSYVPFLQFSARADLREKMWRAFNARALGGPYDNSGNCLKITQLRQRIAQLLGYADWAAYELEERMAKTIGAVRRLLDELMAPSLPAARREVGALLAWAQKQGYAQEQMLPWDFPYWSERYRAEHYALSDEQLKPFFRLEDCIAAVFGLATRLYGVQFVERKDLPVYHPDVRVYDVQDADGRHLALFYADFFPRPGKRSGAWMTNFRELALRGGVEERPLVSIVTNFTKPTAAAPSLLTHDELTTLLHEFGHALHGMLAEGRYPSLTGTNVARDFVELPSQLMENWGFEPEWLHTFARHWQTGEPIPDALVERLVAARNYHAAYFQVRQLRFGLLDLAWHSGIPGQARNDNNAARNDYNAARNDYNAARNDEHVVIPANAGISVLDVETRALADCAVLPDIPGSCISTSFHHIFDGGYSAGYYSYKWAEVLEADAFSLFQERGIFDRATAASFRENVLSKGGSEDEALLYRRFRGHEPDPQALLKKLEII